MTRWPVFLAAPLAVVSPSAFATVYLSVEQAQQAIFPGGSFTALPFSLTEEQTRAIEKRSGVKVRLSRAQAWKVAGGGWFVVDQVIGKYELITYALGINPDGSV